MKTILAAILTTVLALGSASPTIAQAPPGNARTDAHPAAEPRGGGPRPDGPARPPERSGPENRRLPPDSVTHQAVELPGRMLRFTATAGSIPLTDDQGALQAEIAYVAYTLDGADPGSRPVTVALNGGPGAASAYLHLGVLGPWRLPIDGPTISPSASPALAANPETWLDFTDLVFIDPVGTGYSRAVGSGEDIRNRYFAVESDVAYLSDVITRWLKANGRMPSPKFYVGESYGGFRGPLIAEKLQTDQGVGLSGLVLLSPVLDFSLLSQPRHAPFGAVARLPSLAAAALERNGQAGRDISREALRPVEAYAAGEYLVDLTRGLQDKEAVERVSARVADLTGLDPSLVRRLAGRIDPETFQRELDRASGRVASAYDTGVTGYDPDPTAARSRFQDPVLSAMTAPLTSAIVDHLSRTLNFKVDAPYRLLNGAVNGAWRWSQGRSAPESVNELRQAVALDGNLRVLIVHGFTDLVTPYFANQLILNQLPDFGPDKRLDLRVYPGGHMFYTRDNSRRAFREDAMRLYRTASESRAAEAAKK